MQYCKLLLRSRLRVGRSKFRHFNIWSFTIIIWTNNSIRSITSCVFNMCWLCLWNIMCRVYHWSIRPENSTTFTGNTTNRNFLSELIKKCVFSIIMWTISLFLQLCVLLIYTATNVYYLYASRLLAGFAGGAMLILLPRFVAEIADDK